MEQLLFYQHNVQQFFLRHIAKYHGIGVPLSIASSFKDGTSGFLRALCAVDSTKTFLIEPRTALFQRNWNRANVRPPHKRMAEVFGPPFATSGLIRALTPQDFNAETLKAQQRTA